MTKEAAKTFDANELSALLKQTISALGHAIDGGEKAESHIKSAGSFISDATEVLNRVTPEWSGENPRRSALFIARRECEVAVRNLMGGWNPKMVHEEIAPVVRRAAEAIQFAKDGARAGKHA